MFETIGALIDKLFYFGIGIYFIVLSYKNKDKLGNKATITRIAGIGLIIVGILFTIKYIFENL